MFLAWALFGAVIGIAAAQRKGFSMAGGIIGGLLLGPLALLMFLASGGTTRCQHCKEWIHEGATICKHCKQPVVVATMR